jgi:hypothetical protein
MPEIAGQYNHREQLMRFYLLWFLGKTGILLDHYLCSLFLLHKLLSIVRKKHRLCLVSGHVACSAYSSSF